MAESMRNSKNASGVSAGYRGDNFKLGGSRWPIQDSPMGGAQGGPGTLFGFSYESGGIADFIVEAGAGPHDYLSQWMYDGLGNTNEIFRSGVGSALSWSASFTLLVPSVPISVGSVLAPYSGVVYSERFISYGE